MISKEFRKGAELAADQADQYNGSTTHPLRLGDCILSKLNLRDAKPRRNKHKVQNPKNAWACGLACALGEMLRDWQADPLAAVAIAKGAGLTLATFKAAGVDDYDLRALRRAGVQRA
jgi:hypothetical protein